MSAEYFPKIAKDYRTYELFRKRKKPAKGDKLVLQEEKSNSGQQNPLRCTGELPIESGLPNGVCKIHAAISIINRKSYSARIFADYFGESPCLRFCSAGRHHMNCELGKGLRSRAIPTPHFHEVNRHGVMRAYQTDALKQNEQLVQDVGKGIDLFCKESNVVAPDGTPISVKVNAEELSLSIDDPSLSITFYS